MLHHVWYAAVLQRILGVQVSWHHTDRIPKERHVLVSNHLTAGDLMMLYSLPQHYVHLISAKLPERISQVRAPGVHRHSPVLCHFGHRADAA